MTPDRFPTWEHLAATHPVVVSTMRRYLTQLGCVLRPGSVTGADLALRAFTTFLTQAHPQVRSVDQITRGQIEEYKPWLAGRPGKMCIRDRPLEARNSASSSRPTFGTGIAPLIRPGRPSAHIPTSY